VSANDPALSHLQSKLQKLSRLAEEAERLKRLLVYLEKLRPSERLH
jgi:hypothetical protein